jgi:hypothetical protein
MPAEGQHAGLSVTGCSRLSATALCKSFHNGCLRVLVNGSYIEVLCTANQELLVKFCIVPNAEIGQRC